MTQRLQFQGDSESTDRRMRAPCELRQNSCPCKLDVNGSILIYIFRKTNPKLRNMIIGLSVTKQIWIMLINPSEKGKHKLIAEFCQLNKSEILNL